MKILFVYSLREGLSFRHPLATLGDIHIGISYLSAYLKSRHHATRLAVLTSDGEARSLASLEALVAEWDPEVVAFTAVSTQFPFISAAARRLKQKWPAKFMLLGGMHASLRPAEAIAGGFDAICIGEGELPMAELLEQLQSRRPPGGIPNLWFKRPDGSVEKNPCRDFIEDLECLPFPDREIWHEWVMAKRKTHQVVQPSRGCPYNCSYCSNHALRKLAGGKYVRLRTPDDLAREIRELKRQYPELTDIYLQSETIAVNLPWLEEVAAKLEAFNGELPGKLSYACNFRVARAFLNDRVFGALARANVRTIEIGLESGSERLRRDVLRRHYSNADFFLAVQLARRHGMIVNVYNMIGLPGETEADHQATIDANHQVCPARSMTSIFYPYPGTDLYETCAAQGLLKDSTSLTAERTRATLDLPAFPQKDIQRSFEWFEYHVYKGHRSWPFRLRKVLRNKAASHEWSNWLFMRLLPLWYAVRRK